MNEPAAYSMPVAKVLFLRRMRALSYAQCCVFQY